VSSKSKQTFVLLGLVIMLLALMAMACDDEDGKRITVQSLGDEAVTVGKEIGDSMKIDPAPMPLEGEYGKGWCQATGGQWVASIGVCKR
jgi:hypothetical protein